jgi:hypothetical protein
MMALIGEVPDKIERLFPRPERAHRALRELLDGAEHTLDHAMLIAKNFRWFLRLMRATASMCHCLFHKSSPFLALPTSMWVAWEYRIHFTHHQDHKGHEGFG